MSEATTIIDRFSAGSLPVAMFCNGHQIGSATGFMWRHDGEVFFVSNWHVLSGRIPLTGQPRNKDGAIPDAILVLATNRDDIGGEVHLTLRLYREDGSPTWLQSKTFGQKADVAVVNVTKLFTENGLDASKIDICICLNEFPSQEDMHVGVGSEVFVLGFPLGLMKTGKFPVWKRASVATEYAFDVNDMPSFLIDTATREGMSGGPVILRSVGSMATRAGAFAVGSGTYTKILGIYSGRYVGELDEAQLGIVWRTELIEDVIRQGVPGDFELL